MAKKSTKQPEAPWSPRVWIELEVPKNEEQAKKIAALANRMLARLGEGDVEERFVWSEDKQRWMYGYPSFTYLEDRGQWFNLEYFGR